MKMKKTIIFTLLVGLVFMSGCNKNAIFDPDDEIIKLNNYFDDSNRHKTVSNDVGGSDKLSLTIADKTVIENQKVRIILNCDGSIREYVNKESKLYFVKDNIAARPITIDTLSTNSIPYSNYSTRIIEDSDTKKEIEYTYVFTGYCTAITTIALAKDSDEIIFRVKLINTSFKDDQSVLNVQYPIIENIETLDKPETDVFAAPYATGFLFENPIKNFNESSVVGLSKTSSIGYPVAPATYPSGWGYTMQFATYYSKNIGGFYWTTRDQKDFIKSFVFTGMGDDNLRMSIHHYVDDLTANETIFDYDIVVGNMLEGRWQEAASRYKKWAVNQPWVENGLTKNRIDIDKTLYEKTSLVYFGFRPDVSTWLDMIPTYDQIASRIDDNIMNIAIYQNKNYFDIVREYNHQYTVFEFNSITPIEKFRNNAIRNVQGNDLSFTVNGTPFYYQDPSNDDWLENRNITEQGYYDLYHVDALYFDVSFTAVHPIQCFNFEHNHGYNINLLPHFYKQLQNANELAERNGFYSVGTEMITERSLKYIDFYQARANGGPLAWMETDEIQELVDNGTARIIPMFDYVYHEFGGLRMDGYLTPSDDLGDAYYYIAGYTGLNGGVCEFNYEYFPTNRLPSSNSINTEMVDYINRLGKMRTTYGKDYLVYGNMLDAPDLGTGKHRYEYLQINHNPSVSGEWEVDDIVSSAYQNENKIAVFITNVSANPIATGFKLQAERDYGISSGSVYLISSRNNEKRYVGKIKNGTLNIGLNLQPHHIYMLEIEKEYEEGNL